tara:strand:+ start:7396 stop:7782 length:387 start_codon:yes stop_codon:yes gene_type:complete
MTNKTNKYQESTRIAVSKEALARNNNLVLLYLHEKGIAPKRNSKLQRAVASIIYDKYKIEVLFFEKVKRIILLINDEYGQTIDQRKLLTLINNSRRLKGRPLYQVPDYFKDFNNGSTNTNSRQMQINI